MGDADKDTIVLYHASCWDGFGAAWAAWLKFGERAVYKAVQYGQGLPALDWTGKTVYILDFAYSRAELEAIAAQASALLVIDHHATAREALDNPAAGNFAAIFDGDHSGAALTWAYFHPDTPMPLMLGYVEDRDLWRWQMPDSKAYNAALRVYPLEFALWCELAERSAAELISEGQGVLREQQRIIDSHVRHAVVQEFYGHQVPVTNASMLYSEIGHALCDANPDAPFAVAYFIIEATPEKSRQVVYTLRRSRGDFDLGAFAKEHGGGGHAAAASFSRPIEF